MFIAKEDKPHTVSLNLARGESRSWNARDVEPPRHERLGSPSAKGNCPAFIHACTKVNGCPPARAHVQRYFAVTAPSVHQMELGLEHRGLLRRAAGQTRILKAPVAPEALPLFADRANSTDQNLCAEVPVCGEYRWIGRDKRKIRTTTYAPAFVQNLKLSPPRKAWAFPPLSAK